MQPRKCIQNMEPSTFKNITLSPLVITNTLNCSETSIQHQFILQLSIQEKKFLIVSFFCQD